MQYFESALISQTGTPVPSASVTVNITSTGLLATLYSDNGFTVIPNPVTTDANGRMKFYLLAGEYNFVIAGTGIVPYTRTGLVIGNVFAMRDGLLVDTNNNVDVYAVDPTLCVFVDDFFPNGTVGTLGWNVDSGAGFPPTMTYLAGTMPRIGVMQLGQTGASQKSSIAYPSGDMGAVSGIPATLIDVYIIFRLESSTHIRFYAGLASPTGSANLQQSPPSDGVFIHYDTVNGDSGFVIQSFVSGSAVATSATLTVDTNWHKVHIYSNPAGSLLNVDFDTVNKLSTASLTTLPLSVFVQIGTDSTAASAVVDLDYISFRARGLAR